MLLRINGVPYAVTPGEGGLVVLEKEASGRERYALVREGARWRCDCPDALSRGQGCKHAVALDAVIRGLWECLR